jgi:flavoprotein
MNERCAEMANVRGSAYLRALTGAPADNGQAKALNRIADALEAIAAAINRHADVHLYVNDPDAEDAPAEAGNLPDGFRGMR